MSFSSFSNIKSSAGINKRHPNKAKVKITVVSHPISIIGTKRANKKVLNPITSANDVVIMALPDSVIALFIEHSTELPRDLANLYLLTT